MQIPYYGYMTLIKNAHVVKRNNKKPCSLPKWFSLLFCLQTHTFLHAVGPSHAVMQTASRTYYVQLIINTHPELS